ncbi:MAG TPA: riboflavin biosynthesis protein RibF [Synergistetes bacterium]|nr:riboflavin biosynthesis protein RibF [Synergistota bacterium]
MICVLGSFDGFHLGHRKLFEAAEKMASELDDSWCVVTFSPHPQSVLGKGPFPVLFTEPEKDILGFCLGVPEINRITFTPECAELDPPSFLELLENNFFLQGFVVGEDFRFGRGRTGDAVKLAELAGAKSWKTSIVESFFLDGRKVASSSIRKKIETGKADEAARELGYPFFLSGTVIHGQGRGRRIGFPTINIKTPRSKIIPAKGVYSGCLSLGRKVFPAAVNIGINPTFPGIREISCEAHIPGFRGDLYDKEVSLFLFRRIRMEKTFRSAVELVEQMRLDIKECLVEWDKHKPLAEGFIECCSPGSRQDADTSE